MKNFKSIISKIGLVFFMALLLGILQHTNVYAAGGTININNTTLSFNNIIYVDGINGDDIRGNGSQQLPYATLTKANSAVAQDNTCIYVVGAGTYNATNLKSLLKTSYQVTYLVKQDIIGKVVLNLNGTSSGTTVMTKTNSFNGFIFRRPSGADVRIYEYFLDDSNINLEFNNCVFDLINGLPTYYPIFTGNSSGCNVTKLNYNNCSFIPNFSLTNASSGISRGTFLNCAFVKSDFTNQNYNLKGLTFDSNYNITSAVTWQHVGTGTNPDGTVANIGVYGGEFAWGYTGSYVSVTGLTVDKSMDNLQVGQTDTLTVTITPDNATNKNVTWTSSDPTIATVDSTGKVTAVKEGTATITATTQDGSNLSASCAVTVALPVTNNGIVLNVEPEKSKIYKNETVSANLTIDNIKEIAAEDIRIKYDNTKLQFLGMEEVDGIKLVKSYTQPGELRLIVASKGATNIINAKKTLLKLNFKGVAAGEALVDVTKGRVSDGITMERDLTDTECGQTTITIEDLKDVNNSGEFTLLDLAIDARHLGEDPATLTQYNTDIVTNNAIDDADLLEIGNQMLANPNYTF